MTAAIPYSLTFALLASALMQRFAAFRLHQTKLEREAKFSFYSSYVCFFAAIAALAAGALWQ